MKLAIVLLWGILATVPASAAERSAAAETPAKDTRPADLFEDEFNTLDLFKGILKLRPRLRLTYATVIDQPYPGGAEVDSFELGFRASVAVPVTEALALRFSGRVESTLFDFAGDEFLNTGRGGDPFDELLSNGFAVEGRYSLREDWALVAGFSEGSSWERGAPYRDGLDLDGFFGVAHIFRDTLSIIVAAKVGGRPGGKVSWSPVVRIGWRVTKDIQIETQELGLRLAARVTPKLTLYLSGRRDSNGYALEDRGGPPGGRATLRERRVPVLAGARWKITKHWRVRGLVGAIVYQKYVVRDRDGNLFDEERSNGPAFTGRMYLEYRF